MLKTVLSYFIGPSTAGSPVECAGADGGAGGAAGGAGIGGGAFPAPMLPGVRMTPPGQSDGAAKKPRRYPGGVNDVGGPIRALLNLDVFDGFRVEAASPILPASEMMNQSVAPAMVVTHSVMLGSSMVPRTYSIGANYMPTQKELMMGKWDPSSKNLMIQAVRYPYEKVKFSFGGRLAKEGGDEPSVINSGLTYMGDDYALTSTLSHSGQNTGTLALGFMQSVTPNLALGAGINYAFAKAEANLQFGGQYTVGTDTMMALKIDSPQSEPGKATLSFLRQVDQKTKLACEMEVNKGEAVVRAGWEFNLSMTKINGTLDSNLVMMCTVEERFAPGMSLLFSGIMQQGRGQYKFGFGLQMGD